MKRTRMFKWLGVLSAAILLSLVAGAAISAVEGIGLDSGVQDISAVLERIFAEWRGSKPMIALAALCIILAIAGRGIERR